GRGAVRERLPRLTRKTSLVTMPLFLKPFDLLLYKPTGGPGRSAGGVQHLSRSFTLATSQKRGRKLSGGERDREAKRAECWGEPGSGETYGKATPGGQADPDSNPESQTQSQSSDP